MSTKTHNYHPMETWPQGDIPSFERAWKHARQWPDRVRQRKMEDFRFKYKERFSKEPDTLWLLKEEMNIMTREWSSERPFTIEGVFDMVVTKKMKAAEIGNRLSELIHGYLIHPYASAPSDIIQFVVLFAFFRHLDKCHHNWLEFDSDWVREEVERIALLDEKHGRGFVQTFIAHFATERANSPHRDHLLLPKDEEHEVI